MDQRQVYTPFKCAIATVSREEGRGLVHIHDQAIKPDTFAMYIKSVSRLFDRKAFVLVMDNLWVHKDAQILALYHQLKITPIFNVGYAPDFNPIESVFSIVKREYCKRRLHHIANNQPFDLAKNIRAAFKVVKKCQIK